MLFNKTVLRKVSLNSGNEGVVYVVVPEISILAFGYKNFFRRLRKYYLTLDFKPHGD